ncbi:MAG: hypothetical protein WCF79_08605 [Rhodomicrobium sp.]|jgi:hypothetical protein
MPRLTSKDRKSEPKEEFGLPGERKYPMPDRRHAANAKARAEQQFEKGNLTATQKKSIDAKANKKLKSQA